MTVTALAGTPLHELNRALERLDLSLHNLGDIEEQTVAGAISTGTHGTGGHQASLSAQVAGLELVTGEGDAAQGRRRGEPRRPRRRPARPRRPRDPHVGHVARRAAVHPRGRTRRRCAGTEALADFDELVAEQRALRDVLVPAHRPAADQAQQPHPRPGRAALAVPRAGSTTSSSPTGSSAGSTGSATPGPGWSPGSTALAARALSERRYSDVPHKVFTSRRAGGLPGDGVRRAPRGRPAGAARAARPGRASRLADQLPGRGADLPGRRRTPLPRAYRRHSSTSRSTPTRSPTTATTSARSRTLLSSYGGRPHWGKLHSRTAEDLADGLPPLAGLPGDARPARPGPGLHQPLPRPGPRP